MRICNVKLAVGLAVVALFLVTAGRCQGQGSVPAPTQQDIGSNTQGSPTVPLASGIDQVWSSFYGVFQLLSGDGTAPRLSRDPRDA